MLSAPLRTIVVALVVLLGSGRVGGRSLGGWVGNSVPLYTIDLQRFFGMWSCVRCRLWAVSQGLQLTIMDDAHALRSPKKHMVKFSGIN